MSILLDSIMRRLLKHHLIQQIGLAALQRFSKCRRAKQESLSGFFLKKKPAYNLLKMPHCISRTALGAWLVLMVPAAWAQVSTASLNGTVQDNAGAFVLGAKVVAVQTQTNFTTETDSGPDGVFRILSIPVGPYVVKVSKDGFSTHEQSGIVLTVGEVATLRILLRVGSVTQNVVVTAQAPVVESTSSTIQSVVEQQSVVDLPLNGRNPSDLLQTIPGVAQADLNPQATEPNSTIKTSEDFGQQASVTVNGARPSGTYFSLDGAGNVDPLEVLGGLFPNPDATQEFSVVIGSYGARYVSAPGGAVNIITKSGANQIHGSVFEFVRNGFFNARQFLSPQPDTLKRNQYGFAAGGPIIKDKLFAFGSWQYTDIRQPQVLFDFVGTSAMQSGQFENSSGKVPLTIDPVAANVLKYIPAPNTLAPGTNTLSIFSAVLPNPSTESQWVAKLDYNLGQERFFARYFGDRYTDPTREMINSNFLTANAGQRNTWDSYALGDTWTSKSGWIVDGRASLLKVRYTSDVPKSLEALSAKNLGMKNISEPAIPNFPTFCCDLSLDGYNIDTQPRASWDTNLDVIRLLGRHELTFGFNDRWISLNRQGDQFEEPVMLFYGMYSGSVYGLLNDNSYADFILGHPYVFYQADGASQFTHGKLFGAYAEDKYRLSPRFTLSGGLRWDPFLPYTVPHGHISCWSPGVQSNVFPNAPLGLDYPGDPGCSSSGAATSHSLLIQPRLGIAYRVDKQGNTALRAGFGIYSTQLGLNTMDGLSAPPFNRVFEIFNPMQSTDDPWGSNGLSDPFTGGFAGPSYVPPANTSFAFPEASGFNIATLAKNLRPAYVEQWTLSLQHAFTLSDSVELAYVGTEGVHLSQTYDANVPVYGPGANVYNEKQRRPYGAEGLEQIRSLESNSNSSYNGLNATFRHRGKAGINSVTGFNWSRCIDDGSSPAVTFYISAEGNNSRLRHGRCDFDQKLSFRNTFIWTSPGLSGGSTWMRAAFGAWMVSALLTADAGQPTSVTDSADNSMTGIGLDLADRVPGVPVYLARGALNPAAFTINAPGTYGNSGRNSFNTPKYVDVDPALMKTFPLAGERMHWVFRAEAFNVFNHTNLLPAQPDFNQTSIFGYFTKAHQQRLLQFAARITF